MTLRVLLIAGRIDVDKIVDTRYDTKAGRGSRHAAQTKKPGKANTK
jgi:hypothetical protein